LNSAAGTGHNLRHSDIIDCLGALSGQFRRIVDGINGIVDDLGKEIAKSAEALIMFEAIDTPTPGMYKREFFILARQRYIYIYIYHASLFCWCVI
jgi:hypothetical protein